MAPQVRLVALAHPPRTQGLMKDQAYASLKNLILEGSIEPGTFLSERQLAARLKMSKTPVKSALERLETEGFVSVSPQQGIVVQDLTLEEVADHFEIREVLEPYIVRQVAGRLSAKQIDEVHANLGAQQQCVADEDSYASVQLDAEFHLMWCSFLGNTEIFATMQRLRDRIHRIVHRVNVRNPTRFKAGYEEHRLVAEAVLNGDGELAANRMRNHLSFGKQCLLQPFGG